MLATIEKQKYFPSLGSFIDPKYISPKLGTASSKNSPQKASKTSFTKIKYKKYRYSAIAPKPLLISQEEENETIPKLSPFKTPGNESMFPQASIATVVKANTKSTQSEIENREADKNCESDGWRNSQRGPTHKLDRI